MKPENFAAVILLLAVVGILCLQLFGYGRQKKLCHLKGLSVTTQDGEVIEGAQVHVLVSEQTDLSGGFAVVCKDTDKAIRLNFGPIDDGMKSVLVRGVP